MLYAKMGNSMLELKKVRHEFLFGRYRAILLFRVLRCHPLIKNGDIFFGISTSKCKNYT